jgi:hypothetical protein
MTDRQRKVSDGAHDALNRMKRAYDRHTGCYLTPQMIDSLGVTVIGSIWDEPDPRKEQSDDVGP